LLRLANIVKTFGATRAVDDVSFAIAGGDIVALAGENGAGKTTLMRIAAGELSADSGSIERDGAVELVHQHFMLVPDLSIAENLALPRRGFRFARRRTIEEEARATMQASGIELPNVARRVAELSVGEKSKLELIKAISRRPATLVLDEPTSVLAPTESQELFAVMRRLAAGGTAIVFISHKLPEVMEVAQRIVVMRAGRVVAERRTAETNASELAAVMVQAALPGQTMRGRGIRAIVGVAGNGQSELAARWRDEFPDAAHIPEDRTRDGIIAEMSIAENLALRMRQWLPRKAAEHARRMIELYSIRATGPQQRAGSLSGGNQQKVVLARELRDATRIFASEPTRGLDLEATRFVHDQLRAAADGGAEITLITSDLDEAFALAETIQVIYRGRLSEPMTPEEAGGRVAGLMAGIA
jgi:general nucleoside transport system ATP-binding protein